MFHGAIIVNIVFFAWGRRVAVISMKNTVNDMTEGNPLKLIIAFAVPMLIGNIFQQIYNFVDAAVVGRFVGADALAAVGSTGSIISVLVALMMGLTGGGGILISQCFGVRDFQKLRKTVTGLIYIVAVMASAITVIGIFYSPFMLRLLGTPDNVIDDAAAYTRVMFAGLAGMAAYNTAGAVLRSLGDSRTPLVALVISSVMNVVLDLLFVVTFSGGVIGAAIATIIAQTVSAIFCIAHIIRHKRDLNLEGVNLKTDSSIIKTIIKTGLPGALESCLISLGTMSVQRLVNSFGSVTMAAYTASTKIDSIAIAPVISVANAISVFTGQNMGAGKIDRIKKGLYQSLAMIIAACIVITCVIVIFKRQFLSLFLDPSYAAGSILIGERYLSIVCFAYIMAAVMRSYLNVLRGAGDVNISALSGIVELVTRIIFAYILVGPLKITGIWLATPISWAMGAVVPVVRYYSGKWVNKKLV